MNSFILTGYVSNQTHYKGSQEYLVIKLNVNGDVATLYAYDNKLIEHFEGIPYGTYVSLRGHIQVRKTTVNLVVNEVEDLHLLNYNEVESIEKGFTEDFLENLVGNLKWMTRYSK